MRHRRPPRNGSTRHVSPRRNRPCSTSKRPRKRSKVSRSTPKRARFSTQKWSKTSRKTLEIVPESDDSEPESDTKQPLTADQSHRITVALKALELGQSRRSGAVQRGLRTARQGHPRPVPHRGRAGAGAPGDADQWLMRISRRAGGGACLQRPGLARRHVAGLQRPLLHPPLREGQLRTAWFDDDDVVAPDVPAIVRTKPSAEGESDPTPHRRSDHRNTLALLGASRKHCDELWGRCGSGHRTAATASTWDHYQPSRRQIEERRRQTGSDGRLAARQADQTDRAGRTTGRCHAVTHAVSRSTP